MPPGSLRAAPAHPIRRLKAAVRLHGRAALVVASLLSSPQALAQSGGGSEARAAYDRGTAAFNRGDFATAATEYARADELAPNPVALESALKAAVRADDPALVMTLVERSSRAPAPPALASIVKSARDRFARRAGLLTIVCPPGASCRATVDGAEARPGALRWANAGNHEVELSVDGKSEHRSVAVVAGATVEVQPSGRSVQPPTPQPTVEPAPSVPPPASPRPRVDEPVDSEGISPGWFWGVAGLTVVAGGFTIASALEAQHQYDQWQSDRSDGSKSSAQDGALRTNILLVATAVSAVAAVTIGVFAVRWSRSSNRAGALRNGIPGLSPFCLPRSVTLPDQHLCPRPAQLGPLLRF